MSTLPLLNEKWCLGKRKKHISPSYNVSFPEEPWQLLECEHVMSDSVSTCNFFFVACLQFDNQIHGTQGPFWHFYTVEDTKWRDLGFQLGLYLLLCFWLSVQPQGSPGNSSPPSLSRDQKREMCNRMEISTLYSPPRFLRRASTVHWVRHATKHW